MSKLIFIAVPSKGAVENGKLAECFLYDFAKRQEIASATNGDVLQSPMIMNYAILPYLPGTAATWNVWGDFCKAMIDVSRELHVIKFKGWDTSVGVKAEIEYAESIGIPVLYFDPIPYL